MTFNGTQRREEIEGSGYEFVVKHKRFLLLRDASSFNPFPWNVFIEADTFPGHVMEFAGIGHRFIKAFKTQSEAQYFFCLYVKEPIQAET